MVVLAALALGGVTRTRGQESAPKPGAEPIRIGALQEAAARYRIVTNSDPAVTAALKPEPVLRWTNPTRGTVAGAVFVWVAGGRPEVVGSVFRYRLRGAPAEDHEFQSLALGGLTATADGRVAWAPRVAGVSLAPIPGAPAPAATPAERLRQLRALSREFRAYLDISDNRSELRLLTQPLYRYEVQGRPDLTDGALFAFVQTTDPEVLLVIEDRPRGAGGPPAWHYGFARMSMVDLRAEHKGRGVWRAAWDNQVESPDKPYVTLPAVRPATAVEPDPTPSR